MWAGYRNTHSIWDKKTSRKSIICIFFNVMSHFFFFPPTHSPLSQSKFYPDVNMKRPVFVCSLPLCIPFHFPLCLNRFPYYSLEHRPCWKGEQSCRGMQGSQEKKKRGIECSRTCVSSLLTQTEARQGEGPWVQTNAISHAKPHRWCAHVHTHTLSWKTVLSHPRKDLLFQLNPSSSTPHVRKERKNQIKPELLWPSPWGSIHIK